MVLKNYVHGNGANVEKKMHYLSKQAKKVSKTFADKISSMFFKGFASLKTGHIQVKKTSSC